ncbi:alpha/beta hydrolase [Paraburkholderia bonniea]|uniref:alpha/beta hydrolase n=1 Tax=Paraburkholderia bonniea TaxID=2152891 RepID=UPI001290D947|nr:alpha/beta hydrolase [Paraburkholderia bonniea]WJF91008.1 alpha/beta hydrolase [Paraburkholderia bonniea]WJF94322.1 alpha/beta hydrolase [Paraburkholderia bonniea]
MKREATQPDSLLATPNTASTPSTAASVTANSGGTTYVTTRDGVKLPLYRWPAHGTTRATVALLHGLAEHAQRYQALAQELNAAGIELLALDLRGHGHAPGARTWVSHFDEYLLDAEALLRVAARSGHPLFLMGHSMGGSIAALYAIERANSHGTPLAGLILSSPALAPGRDVPRWMLALSQVISRIWPRFPALKIKPELLARDPAVVEANRRDPLVHHRAIPARTGAELLLAMTRIKQGRGSLRTPVLVYHGTSDKLTEPDGSQEFGAHVGSPDATLTLYDAAYHETMNDLERERVIQALLEWIIKRAR